MSQPDKPKNAASRKGSRKTSAAELQNQVTEMMAARDAAQKQAMDLHAGFQDLSRHAAELENQLGELDQELKKAREESAAATVQAASREEALAALRPQLERAQKEHVASLADLARANDLRIAAEAERDRFKKEAGGLEQRCAEHSGQAALLVALEREATALRAQLHQVRGAEENSRRELEAAVRKISGLESELEKLRAGSGEQQQRRADAEAESTRLRSQLSDLKRQVERAEERAGEATRYFESLERELISARDWEMKAQQAQAEAARVREEAAELQETCREQQGWLDELGQTVVELEHRLEAPRLDEARPPAAESSAPPAPPPPPSGTTETPPSESIAPPAGPPAAVPGPSAAETTLRLQNFFGPAGEDGEPLYVLHELRSRDEMGAIYRASERASGRVFAVRFMSGQSGDEETRAIEREVEKLIALPHPNILHVQGIGRRKNRIYLAMDFVDAPTLGQAKIQDPARICAILRDVAAAVHYAHEEGILHGDLNPENVLVASDGLQDNALVKDFGIGRLLESIGAPSPGKEGAVWIRNPAFLPPEQVRVLKTGLSEAGDVYSLGATLYGALAGRPPFEGKDVQQVVKRVMIEEPLPIEKVQPGVPEALGAIIRKAMAKERGLRYAAAQEMAAALTRFLDGR